MEVTKATFQREMWTWEVDYGEGIFANIILQARLELINRWIPTAIAESIQFNEP